MSASLPWTVRNDLREQPRMKRGALDQRVERKGVRTSVMHFHSLRVGYVNQDSRPFFYDKNVVLPQNVKGGRHVSLRKDCGRERSSHFEPGHRNAEPPV